MNLVFFVRNYKNIIYPFLLLPDRSFDFGSLSVYSLFYTYPFLIHKKDMSLDSLNTGKKESMGHPQENQPFLVSGTNPFFHLELDRV